MNGRRKREGLGRQIRGGGKGGKTEQNRLTVKGWRTKERRVRNGRRKKAGESLKRG